MIPVTSAPREPPPPTGFEGIQAPVRRADWARPNWLAAIGLGLLAALASAVVWAFLSVATGYIFALAAIFLGLLIAYAVKWGAKHVTGLVIVLAFLLTIFGVFLGDVLGLTLAAGAAGFDVGITDVLAHYPEILALSPGDAFLVYVFGLIGAGAGAASLYREMRTRPIPRRYPANAPLFGGGLTGADAPKFRVVEYGATRATATVTVPMTPEHTVVATFENVFGKGSVDLDGMPFQQVHVLGREKVIQVPLEGNPRHVLDVRFWGAIRPRITFRMEGRLVGEV